MPQSRPGIPANSPAPVAPAVRRSPAPATRPDPVAALAACTITQAAPDDLIELGRIGEPYGIKGWVNVLAYSADSTALKTAKTWFLRWSAQHFGRDTALVGVQIAQSRLHSGRLVAQVQGVDDRNLAEVLKGASVWVSRSLFPPLKKGEFYWVDLIGMSVVNREGVHLGVVYEVIDHGAHPILCLPGTEPQSASGVEAGPAESAEPTDSAEPTESAERLIPFVPAYIDKVDLPTRQIHVDWQIDY